MTNQPDKSCLSHTKSYVRRGRITASQRQALEEYGDQILLPVDKKLSTAEAFSRRAEHLCMEVGFGMGENLLELATENPNINFLGVDVHAPGIGRVVRDVHHKGLNNIRLYQNDIVDLLRNCIPEGTINSCLIFFPDPWPKTKHHKRRLIQPNFIDLLWRTLAKEGVLWLATDWQPYAEHIISVFGDDRRWVQTDQSAVSFSRKLTRFELRGALSKHIITDCLWRKV